MPVRHRRSTGAVRRPRRQLVWATLDQTVPIGFGAHNNLDLLAALEVAGSSRLGCTIMRTIVRLEVGGAAVATDGTIWGLVVGRTLDIGAGVGPNPNADLELDWM